ncbi:MAG TPA: hypothetical protein VN647_04445 [Nitrospira sp.]|nr:hypothetical protein [Nitrospira sp.]
MGRAMLMLILVSLMLVQNACSVAWALKQPPAKDLEGLGIGTPRQQLIDRLGIPKLSETDPQGRKQDMFEFQSGMHQASKLRIIPYLAADVFTVCLAELILWPMEVMVLKEATCNAFATYDSSQNVETWRVNKASQSGLEAQGC